MIYFITAIAPLVIIGIISLILISSRAFLYRFDLSDQQSRKRRFTALTSKFIYFALFLLYANASASSLSYLKCTEVQGVYYLVQDFTQQCYTMEWKQYLPYAVFFCVLYPLGVPAFFYFSIRKAKG